MTIKDIPDFEITSPKIMFLNSMKDLIGSEICGIKFTNNPPKLQIDFPLVESDEAFLTLYQVVLKAFELHNAKEVMVRF